MSELDRRDALTDQVTNRCSCGWEVTGTVDEVVDATIDHGARLHNMAATRDDVLTAMGLTAAPAGERGPNEAR
jgi:predicted small metal-binding protein